jgi:hypothetical protein
LRPQMTASKRLSSALSAKKPQNPSFETINAAKLRASGRT